MNHIIYKQIIVPWIRHHERPIVNKEDLWLLNIRKICKDIHYCSLLVDIILHTGIPCVKRYCICTYFSDEDKSRIFRDEFPYYYKKISHEYINVTEDN